MKRLRHPPLRLLAMLCFFVTVAACDGDAGRPLGPEAGSAELRQGGTASNARVIPPQAHPHGGTYDEWAAAWWQYMLSVPVSQNPLLDDTGANCAVSQTGHIFFLAGTLGGTAVRTECVIPTGVMLFLPILNSLCTNEPPPLTPTPDLAPCAAFTIDLVTDLAVEIDGAPVGDLTRFRAAAPAFGLTLPEDNLLDLFFGPVPAGSCFPDPDVGACVPWVAATDGYWVMLPPLPPGEHTLHISAAVHHPEIGLDFVVDVTFAPLTVAPRGEVS